MWFKICNYDFFSLHDPPCKIANDIKGPEMIAQKILTTILKAK